MGVGSASEAQTALTPHSFAVPLRGGAIRTIASLGQFTRCKMDKGTQRREAEPGLAEHGESLDEKKSILVLLAMALLVIGAIVIFAIPIGQVL